MNTGDFTLLHKGRKGNYCHNGNDVLKVYFTIHNSFQLTKD